MSEKERQCHGEETYGAQDAGAFANGATTAEKADQSHDGAQGHQNQKGSQVQL